MRFSNPQKTRYRKNLNTQTHKNGHIRKRIPQLRIVRIMHKFAAAKQSKRPKITAEIKFRTGTLAQKDNFPRTHTSTIHMYIHIYMYPCIHAHGDVAFARSLRNSSGRFISFRLCSGLSLNCARIEFINAAATLIVSKIHIQNARRWQTVWNIKRASGFLPLSDAYVLCANESSLV